MLSASEAVEPWERIQASSMMGCSLLRRLALKMRPVLTAPSWSAVGGGGMKSSSKAVVSSDAVGTCQLLGSAIRAG